MTNTAVSCERWERQIKTSAMDGKWFASGDKGVDG